MPKMQTDDGIELHYHVDDFRDPWISDPGETILMCHGFSRSMKWWTQWVPALSRKYRVVRLDVRGCGHSAAPPKDAEWSAHRLAQDALNLMDHLGIQKVHWVGFESGGMWGYVFANDHPDRIISLTVLNTPSVVAGRAVTFLTKEGFTGSEAIEKTGLRQWLIDTFDVNMDMTLAPASLREWHIDEQAKTPHEVAFGISRILETLNIPDMYAKVKVPTLIMVGDKAFNCPVEEQRVVENLLPNGRMVVFPQISAGAQLLIPDRCTDEVIHFLESL